MRREAVKNLVKKGVLYVHIFVASGYILCPRERQFGWMLRKALKSSVLKHLKHKKVDTDVTNILETFLPKMYLFRLSFEVEKIELLKGNHQGLKKWTQGLAGALFLIFWTSSMLT